MSAYPTTYEVDYVEPRNRVTVFFRLLLAIPHFFLGFFVGLAAFFSIVAAWFTVVLTGRYPQALYDFNAGVLRWNSRVYAYVFLQSDPFPPFGFADDPDYPTRVRVAPPLPEYSRLLAFFRFPLAIIPLLVTSVMINIMYFVVVAAWFVQVITGKQPKGIHDVTDFCLAYQSKTYAYLMLLTEKWPPFSNEDATLAMPGQAASIGLGGSPAPSFAPPVVDTTKRF